MEGQFNLLINQLLEAKREENFDIIERNKKINKIIQDIRKLELNDEEYNTFQKVSSLTQIDIKLRTDSNNVINLEEGREPKSNGFKILILFILFLGLTLPFHWIIIEGIPKFYLKSELSFKYTFVTTDDVTKLVDRFNEASFLEQAEMRNESILKVLIENELITQE